MTLFDPIQRFYAQIEGPPTFDDALMLLTDKFQTSFPVAGVLADPYEKMWDGLKTAVDLGVVNVDGIRVRHLLFTILAVGAVAGAAAASAARPPAVVVAPRPVVYAVPAPVVVGTVVHALPAGCSAAVINGVQYFNCGGDFYQPVPAP